MTLINDQTFYACRRSQSNPFLVRLSPRLHSRFFYIVHKEIYKWKELFADFRNIRFAVHEERMNQKRILNTTGCSVDRILTRHHCQCFKDCEESFTGQACDNYLRRSINGYDQKQKETLWRKCRQTNCSSVMNALDRYIDLKLHYTLSSHRQVCDTHK